MPKYIACVPWGEQSVSSVQMKCGTCGCAVALDRKNESKIKELKLVPLCWNCLQKLDGEWDYGESLVGGKEYADFDEATQAAMKEKFDYENRN